jgi:predicted transcriptional regulator of viral defense system
MATSRVPQVVALAHRKGLLRPRDLAEVGIPRQYLRMALEQGQVEKVARGLYQVPGERMSQHVSLAEVCKRVPAGVICLISALEFHELTTQIPHFVYLAIPEKAHAPRIEALEVRIFRFSRRALAEGVEKHDIDGVEVRVYSAAKTVADCFKYRNKIGQDLAIEALRDCLRERRATVEELVRYGRICRVERVMRPYMEAMLG